jgi:HK97 family phage portal protein
MLLFGRNWLSRSEKRELAALTKASVAPVEMSAMYPGPGGGGWYAAGGTVHEPFTGAWQRNISLDAGGLTAFSAVYACISLRARSIGKMRIKLMEQDESGIWSEVRGASPFKAVLSRPNRYQNRIQFLEYWMASKLFRGNTYVLKDRDQRGIVTDMYPLDAGRVRPLVADDGSIWYSISADNLTGVRTGITVPASEIIHDRAVPLFHPLVGVSPIYAAGISATQGMRIQANSERFFANMSAPSGHLSAEGTIKDETAERLRRDFEQAKGGANLGRLLVTGDGMKYQPFAMSSVDAQLIEQLRWTVEDVARCFGVPLHKIMAGAIPQVGNMAALDQSFYADTCQEDIESIEILLDDGLELANVSGKTYGTELDLEGLLRMDPLTRADRLEKLVRASVLSPDEARASENLSPVDGGDSPMAQQQNFSLAALAKRDAKEDPFGTDKPAPTPAPAAANDDTASEIVEGVRSMFEPLVEQIAAMGRELQEVKQRPQFGAHEALTLVESVMVKAKEQRETEDAEATATCDRFLAGLTKDFDLVAA